jgi:hypothetical protein
LHEYWADDAGWFSCEQVPQHEGIVNHEPADPVVCHQCGHDISPSRFHNDRWFRTGDPNGRWGCIAGGYHRPAPEEAEEPEEVAPVNEGRLNINVGLRCVRCRKAIKEGEPSHRRWSGGRVTIRHNDCQPPPPRYAFTGNTWTTVPTYKYHRTGSTFRWDMV